MEDTNAGGPHRGRGGGVHLAVTDDHAELGSEFAAAPHDARNTRPNRSGACIVGAFVNRLVDGVDQPQPVRSDALKDGGSLPLKFPHGASGLCFAHPGGELVVLPNGCGFALA